LHRLLREIALAGAEHLDPAYVAGYDRKAAFDPTDDLRELGLGANSTVIDLGAGTGTFAAAAATVCKRVIAVDVSPAMLDAVRARGVPNVECVQAGFLSYEGDGADVVYTRNALHHLPDFWKAIALKRVAGLLPLGGVLRLRDLVFSFEPQDAEHRIAEWLDRAAERPEDGWTREELETHLREEHSTFAWLLEPMLEHAGFEIESAEYRGGVYAAYTCVKRI
jgi:SAM-dependent methyltransferase